MDSKFSHLFRRDTSVSMLRVKMSRRRSQTQKENRERTVNTRRKLDKLMELDASCLDASTAVVNMSVAHERTLHGTAIAKKAAVEERVKQLERWREHKALQREKEKREKERKGVFKTGLYHPKDTLVVFSQPWASSASDKVKEIKENTAPAPDARVTRSMKQQQKPVQRKPLKMQEPNTLAFKAQPVVQRLTRTRAAAVKSACVQTKTKTDEPVSSRSAIRPPVTKTPAAKDKAKEKPAEARTTRSRAVVGVVVPFSVAQKKHKEPANTTQPAVPTEPERKTCPSSPLSCCETTERTMDQPQDDCVPAGEADEAPSFAPKDFIFQAPVGLATYRFEPLTPRSADAFLRPSISFSLLPAPVLDHEPQHVSNNPPPATNPQCSPPGASPAEAAPTPTCSMEAQHDVPYFRAEIANGTNRLMSLCVHWEAKVEDESIPEEMRDRMRTAVGQARLLMKERFKQFSGLVDDCEFSRGEKITTCTDLQGFWDMVYYQVEDVNKKFDALKEAESRAWVEDRKPPPRPKKAVMKPSGAPVKPTGSKAAAKSRLAAVKAAMKARQQAAETIKEEPQTQTASQPAESVVFDGGFFQVESPARPAGSLRRSSRLSAVQPQASPCYLSPRRVTRRSLALAQTPVPASPSQCSHPPGRPSQTPVQAPKSLCGTPRSSQKQGHPVHTSLAFTAIKEALPDECQQEPVSECSLATNTCALPVDSVTEEPTESLDVVLPPTCQPFPVVCPAAEPSHPSLTLSPCVTPGRASISAPLSGEAGNTPVVEELPGLDFERYLQPSQRCSLSPREIASIEMLSPMAVDVEMESPKVQSEELLPQQKAALPAVSSLPILHSPQTQTVNSALLLFTPDPKDRIRQSVCPSDLMVFTPPL
ncbi:disks large-associated protein 5 isoform X1 [Takifugu rubripes]|uniref:Discs, large (Drosophila) homolog-associated protein 5 n=1 Tax=Takifugu rubripes TaxID=31033 RepID=H2V1F4_TAKRU|nr:disks large-associated protein 5 isoform X1 [Takifugu rubripes]